MKITFEGREWDFDEDEIDVKQATVLYMTYKMTLKDWIDGLGQVDQRSLHFTYWLMLQQNGVVKPIAECNPKLIAFGVAYGEAREAAAAAAEPAPDPTQPSPMTPSPPGVPPSPVPATPTAMTPVLPVPVPLATVS